MTYRIGAAVAAAGALLAASPAGAAVFTVVYEGIVVGAYDDYGRFGGALVENAQFTLSFTVDTATPGSISGGSPWYDLLEGVGAANPVQGAFTVGSTTVSFGDDRGGDYRYDNSLDALCTVNCAEAGIQQTTASRIEDFGDVYHFLSVAAQGNAYGSDGQFSGKAHTPPGNFTSADDVQFYGWFSAEEFVYDYDTKVKTTSMNAGGRLKIDSVSVSAAPEPGAWALMILGFGGVGAVLRRRSSAAAASA